MRGGRGAGEGGLLEWESVGGSARVGVRNRLGEAIGKPVANLHGRWTSAATVPREKGKKGTPLLRFSADRSTYLSNPFSFHFSSLHLWWEGIWVMEGEWKRKRKVIARSKNGFRISGRIMSWILDSGNSDSSKCTTLCYIGSNRN